MPLLVHCEVEHLVDLEETLLTHVITLDPVHERLQGRIIREELHQLRMPWHAPLDREQLLASLELLSCLQMGLRLAHEPRGETVLLLVQSGDKRVVLLERR